MPPLQQTGSPVTGDQVVSPTRIRHCQQKGIVRILRLEMARELFKHMCPLKVIDHDPDLCSLQYGL